MNKFLKNLSNLNLLLLVLLVCICVLALSTILTKKYNNYKVKSSVEKTINRINGIREGFADSQNEFGETNESSEVQAQKAIIQAEEYKKEQEALQAKKEDEEKAKAKEDAETESIEGLGADQDGVTLDTMFTNLNDLEKKCKSYEDRQRASDKEEKHRHEELIQEQLDIENVKINELTQIVNFYRKKYNEKKAVTGQCRKQKFGALEKTLSNVDSLHTKTNGASKQEVKVQINPN
tara:strand:- start:1900 stop:2604 length:705 start_codon:yes stop_codon:yes gene_type:complete